MADPTVLHSITAEMCTGFLLIATVATISRLASDEYLHKFRGKSQKLDRWATLTSNLGDPASYFALGAGIVATFVSMTTGMLAWPMQKLVQSATVHNLVLLAIITQTIFIGAFLIRLRKGTLWRTRATSWVYTVVMIAGAFTMTLQNSMGGHLSGIGSILDDMWAMIGVDVAKTWLLPEAMIIPTATIFPIGTLALWLSIRLRHGMIKPTPLKTGRDI